MEKITLEIQGKSNEIVKKYNTENSGKIYHHCRKIHI